MKSFKSLLALLLFLAVFVAPHAQSQTTTTGDVTGVVSDPSGAVVPSAQVSLENTQTGVKQTATTNGEGVYRFTLLPPGPYSVSASIPGLSSDIDRISVQVGQVANINLVAKPQSTTQTIEVTTTAQVLQTENANLSRTFSTQQLQDLPAPGGDLTTVAFTVPGVVVNTGGGYGNFSSHGLPGTANLFTINGNDYNDPYLNLNNSGASNLLLGQNDVAEASVVQNAYSVEYGRNAGAQVNYVTKSGGNSFHGNLVYNYNGTLLNANDFFNNLNGVGRPHAVSNQYAASIGGPAVRNKLFFFLDGEGLRDVLPTAGYVTTYSPQLQNYILSHASSTAAPLYQGIFNEFSGINGKSIPVTTGGGPLQDASGNLGCADFAGTAAPGGGTFGIDTPCAYATFVNSNNLNTEWLMTARVDYNINDKQKIYFRFKADHGDQATGTNLVNSSFNVSSIQPQYEGQINHTYVISPNVVNNFIGSVLWYSAIFTNPNLNSIAQQLPVNVYVNSGATNTGGFYQGGFGYGGIGYDVFPQGRNSGQLGLVDDLSIVAGKHTVKMGFNFRGNDVSDYTLQENAHGSYFFNTLTDFVNGVTNPNTGSAYIQNFSPIGVAHIRLYNVGLYVQDEWSFRDNFKVTYGLRLEHTANPWCNENCFSRLAVPFTSSNYTSTPDTPYNQTIETNLHYAYPDTDVATLNPRVGVVWSPNKGRSTVFRAGAGLFSDLPPGNIVASLFSNQPYLFSSVVFQGQTFGLTNDPNSAASSALAQYNAFKTGFAAGQTETQLNNSIPGGFGGINFFSPPNHLSTPEYAEWSAEIEQPFGSKNVLVVTYSGNHGYNLFLINPFANTSYNPNNFPNGFGGLPAVSPDVRFNAVSQLTNSGISNYDGLSVQFRRSFSAGFQGQIGYTWSHALDDISSLPGEPFNFNNSLTTQLSPYAKLNYSNSDTDIRHNLVADFIYDTPWKSSNRALSLLTGWTVGGKFFARTGSPFSIVDGTLASAVSPGGIGGGGTISAEALTSSLPHTCGSGSVNTPCFTPADFACPPAANAPNCGSGVLQTNFGNLARNAFFGPGYFDIDATLFKNFNITERARLRIGAQAFNLLNHPNFANPVVNPASGIYGNIFGTVSAPTSPYGSFVGAAVSGRVLVLSGRFDF